MLMSLKWTNAYSSMITIVQTHTHTYTHKYTHTCPVRDWRVFAWRVEWGVWGESRFHEVQGNGSDCPGLGIGDRNRAEDGRRKNGREGTGEKNKAVMVRRWEWVRMKRSGEIEGVVGGKERVRLGGRKWGHQGGNTICRKGSVHGKERLRQGEEQREKKKGNPIHRPLRSQTNENHVITRWINTKWKNHAKCSSDKSS